MFKYLTLIFILAIFVSSCSKSSNPASPGSGSIISPKAGSSFTFDNFSTDTTTGLPVPGTRDTSVDTFLKSGIAFMGKTNVSEIEELSQSQNSRDTLYLNYEPNGDITEFITSGGAIKWYTIPTGTKSPSSWIFDTTITGGGYTEHSKSTLSISFIDNETMTVKGQSFNVMKLELSSVSTDTVTPPGTTTSTSDISFAYFAPSLGYITKSEIPVSTYQGSKSEGNISTLIDFVEK